MSKKSNINSSTESSKTFSTNQEETPKNEEEPIIGIDLGTTYCCASIFKNIMITIIEDKGGKRTIPSLITIKNKEIIFGHSAKI